MSRRRETAEPEPTGQEPQGRDRPGWIRENPLLVGSLAATIALVVVAVALDVFGGNGGASSLVTVTPTPQGSATATGQDSGPPPVTGEPTITDSGLGIIDIKVGTGETPKAGQTLVVDYTGWLSADGTKFDSSVDRGTPFEFVLGAGQVIPGWDEGIATMKVGGKRRLLIPADLAYGEAGSPPTIPANADLTFDVELLQIKDSQ
jgi:peptidylprolyl isomerase